MSHAKQPEARTQWTRVSFTREEWAQLNAMRLAAGREVSMAMFCRALILDILADDQAAHRERAQA